MIDALVTLFAAIGIGAIGLAAVAVIVQDDIPLLHRRNDDPP